MTENINQQPTEVTLAVSSMSVAEDGSKALEYTFTREQNITQALIINFTLDGTANSEDYDLTGADEGFDGSQGKVTIAANQSTATITITPKSDTVIESDETIKLTVPNGSDYIIIDDSEQLVEAKAVSSTNEDVMKMAVISNDDPMLDAPWAEKFNGSGYGYEFLAVDGEGNTYVTGDFTGSVTLGNDTLTAASGMDVFVAKLDKDGKVQWAKDFGGINDESAEDITVDKNGNTYFTGTFSDQVTFGSETLESVESNDAFVAKLDNTGEVVWAKQFGGIGSDEASGIEVDKDDNTYITGKFEAQVSFSTKDGDVTLDGGQSSDVFVAKLNSDGDLLWAKDFGDDSELDEAEDIVVDKDGNTYLFMTENVESGKENVFLTKLDKSDGSEVWKQTFGDENNYVVAKDIVIDSTDNIFITGEFKETVTFGGTPNAPTLDGGSNSDLFVAKVDSKGDVLWAKDFDSGEDDNVEVEGIAVDDMGNTYVTGYYESKSMSVGNFMLYDQGGDKDAFIAKFDSNGEVKWAQNLGGANYDKISDIAVNDGKIYLAGEFYDEATFGDTTLKANNSSDTFLVKLEGKEEQKPEISLAVDSEKVTEGDNKTITYTFTRKGDFTSELTVEFSVTGSATFNDDYTLTGADDGFNGTKGKVTFKAGEETATVTLNIQDDTDDEEDETLGLELAMGSGYMLSATAVKTNITITKDEKDVVIGSGSDEDDDDDDDDDDTEFTLTSKVKQTFKFKSKFKNGKSSIKFSFKSKNIAQFKEIAFVTVDDDEGTIDGLSSDDEGYIEAALERSQSIFSLLGNTPNGFGDIDIEKVLEFSSETRFRFLSVKGGTLQGVKKGKIKKSQVTFSSTDSLQVSESEKNSFDLNFEGVEIKMKFDAKAKKAIGSGLQDTIEVIDLRGDELTGKQKAKFSVHREAAYDNLIGFYKVIDEDGGIDTDGDGTADVFVGDAGYAEAAVQNRIASIDLSVENQSTANFEGEFDAGAIFVPFLIVDGTINNFKEIFFPFLGANSDGTDHVMMLGGNTFGFEDLPGGGDGDYNDIIVKVDFNVTNTVST